MILRQGSKGPDVEALQRKLAAAGYHPGAPDGDFGPKTAAAVLAFQKDRPNLDDDQLAGPATLAALDGAVTVPPVAPEPAEIVPCDARTFAAYEAFETAITRCPVRYGPGRGLFVDGKFVVGYTPGRKAVPADVETWPNVLGRIYPALHCTSFTNLFLSWLLRRNQEFTHAGNIPSLFDLMKNGPELHQIKGGGIYRGFGGQVTPIKPDGTGAKRSGFASVMDAKEILDRARRNALPTFVVCAQSTIIAQKPGTKSQVNWWHHTLLWICRDARLWRFAADGYKSSYGYSGNPIKCVEITDANVGNYFSAFYSGWGVNTTDGSYGDQTRPIAMIDFER